MEFIDDIKLLSSLESINAHLSGFNDLETTLKLSRLELSFSRFHRGSLIGASIAYVPLSHFRSKVRIIVKEGLIELINDNNKQEKGYNTTTTNSGNELLSGLRHRKTGKSIPNKSKSEEKTNIKILHISDDKEYVTDEREPLSWFGENSSPSILSSKVRFENVLQICIKVINIRSNLQRQNNIESL
jgi:hypothetical protein